MRTKSHPQYFISKPRRSFRVGITIGIDPGDIWSHYCTLSQLYMLDRLVLGANNSQLSFPRDRFSEMTDEELVEELKRVRALNDHLLN
jgi:hypothetical protein